MPIPAFESDELLPRGSWEAQEEEFTQRFCTGTHRQKFNVAFRNVCAFARSRGAVRVVIGGSFVTAGAFPNDLDCLVIFARQEQIPERKERLSMEGFCLDVLFCSEEKGDLLDAFVYMLQRTRNARDAGVVSIAIDQTAAPLRETIYDPKKELVDLVRCAYNYRHVIDLNNSKKVLVTIHGIRSHAEWNGEITHLASSAGWIVAPFIYGYRSVFTLMRHDIRDRLTDRLRDHLMYLKDLYGANLSIIAHSYGTFLIGRYLYGTAQIPTPIDTLILTGSILRENVEFAYFEGKVARIINEVSTADKVVNWARFASLGREPLIGKSGSIGFEQKHSMLKEFHNDVFNHDNVIKRDVVLHEWLPWLEASVGLAKR